MRPDNESPGARSTVGGGMEEVEHRAESLVELVERSLIDDAAFISYGGDDDIRYLAGAEALEALAWFVGSIALPILTGIASSAVYDRIRRRRAAELEPAALAIIRQQVIDAADAAHG